jgi:hypothetical protein
MNELESKPAGLGLLIRKKTAKRLENVLGEVREGT